MLAVNAGPTVESGADGPASRAESASALQPHHATALLHDSGIDPAVVEERGYRTVTSRAELERLGFSPKQRIVPTLVAPLWSVTGEIGLYHHRPDHPRIVDGKPAKYEFPARARMIVDVHPRIREKVRDPRVPLFITEGCKKADAAISRGLCCAAVIGTWNFRGRNEQDGMTALPDWESFALKGRDEQGAAFGRQVYICYDSDVMIKPQVYGALVRLSAFLKHRGASAAYIYLPAGDGATKTGLDDYLASGHTVDDLLALASHDLRQPPVDEPKEEEAEPACQYRETRHGIVWDKPTQDGKVPTPLTNFTARIVAAVTEDDGAEQTTVYDIEARCGSRASRFAVPAANFAALNWTIEQLDGIIEPGMGTRDRARHAIQVLSGGYPRRVTYKHLGWRNLGTPEEPRWAYLHAGAAIGAQPGEASINLPTALSRYTLPEPPTDGRLCRAVRASLQFLDLAAPSTTFPLYAAIWRAVLGRVDASVFIVGRSGAYKSETAALIQQHFGAGMDRTNLPANWSSTPNALEILAFQAKDAVLTIDDFAPRGSTQDVQRFHRDVDRVLRGQGNGQGRGRLQANLQPRAPRPPRGLILCTGEDTPSGHSLQARTLFVEVEKGSISVDVLTRCQQDAGAGLYAQTTSAFVAWLAPRYERAQGTLQGLRDEYRAKALAQMPAGHARTPEIAANLAVGLRWFLRFAAQSGAVTQEQASDLWQRGWTALLDAASQQHRHHANSEPVPRFIQLLSAAIASGQAHVAGPDGRYPPDPLVWGWAERSGGAGDQTYTDYVPRGACIGYLSQGADDEPLDPNADPDLFLIPDAAYNAAKRMGADSPDGIAITPGRLWKHLRDDRKLVATDAERQTLTVRKTLGGVRRNVLHLRAETIVSCVSARPAQPAQPVQSNPSADEMSVNEGADERQPWSGFASEPEKPDHKTRPPANHPAFNGHSNGHAGTVRPIGQPAGMALAVTEYIDEPDW